ncbi:SUF system Fe-S cluster assembly protein [Acuticoccus sp. I52.16.1]|uniref:SUF system Fe-S cluster assembly protein n=1 Tax=Acuticoccus sp. I52.16.1 TaxID=2928472 RepID=UPI00352C5E93
MDSTKAGFADNTTPERATDAPSEHRPLSEDRLARDAEAVGGGLPETEVLEPGTSAIPEEELDRITQDIIAALKTVYDPEIPVDIYELGLIYRVDIEDDRSIRVDMTLTAPGCPVAGEMPGWVENAIGTVEGVGAVLVNMVFDPPWDPSRMSDEARVALDMF